MSEHQESPQEPLSDPSAPSTGESAVRGAVDALEYVDRLLRAVHQDLLKAPKDGRLSSAPDMAIGALLGDVGAAIHRVGQALLEGRHGIRRCELEREQVLTRRG